MADRMAGEWLAWDAESLRFPDHPAADTLLRRQYREGWQVDGLG